MEGEAQGEEDAIHKLVKELGIGPSHAKVERLENSDIDVVDGEMGFEVRGSWV